MHYGKTTYDIPVVLIGLNFIYSFMTGNFNSKLSRGFEGIANRILHVFSLTKVLPVSIY